MAQDARRAPILVTGNNLDVTEPIKDYVEKKVINVLDKVLSTAFTAGGGGAEEG